MSKIPEDPQSVPEALAFLVALGAAQQGRSGTEWATPKGFYTFILYPEAVSRGRPVADAFCQLAAQQYMVANRLRGGVVLEADGGYAATVEDNAGQVLAAGYGFDRKPGLSLCRGLWDYVTRAISEGQPNPFTG